MFIGNVFYILKSILRHLLAFLSHFLLAPIQLPIIGNKKRLRRYIKFCNISLKQPLLFATIHKYIGT